MFLGSQTQPRHTDFLNPNPELNGDAEVSWGGFLIPVL